DLDPEADGARPDGVAELVGGGDELCADHPLQQVVGAARRQLEALADLGKGHAVRMPHQEFEDVEDPGDALVAHRLRSFGAGLYRDLVFHLAHRRCILPLWSPNLPHGPWEGVQTTA